MKTPIQIYDELKKIDNNLKHIEFGDEEIMLCFEGDLEQYWMEKSEFQSDGETYALIEELEKVLYAE